MNRPRGSGLGGWIFVDGALGQYAEYGVSLHAQQDAFSHFDNHPVALQCADATDNATGSNNLVSGLERIKHLSVFPALATLGAKHKQPHEQSEQDKGNKQAEYATLLSSRRNGGGHRLGKNQFKHI